MDPHKTNNRICVDPASYQPPTDHPTDLTQPTNLDGAPLKMSVSDVNHVHPVKCQKEREFFF